MTFWYNVRTGQVEPDETKSAGENLMGPYETREEAQRALETAKEKTEAWDEEDREYNEWGEGEKS
ncbi:hypothetical protein BJY21_004206 [Kineosphaera limosa]|uniref:Methionine aminopeptidase n=1 Tax=Kineosphaera limosa NBRC 100340 TaxID=1184609 RepID=K6W7B8_9MICO|nr:hypothetical protein [Kineosphaera limosa]NYE03022.1 hypothetical protein [Kineosphaera limosa]GAB95085.1 hypothetical protein KILIM_016_00250 [Kineosphaera limosa NBRC 100340]